MAKLFKRYKLVTDPKTRKRVKHYYSQWWGCYRDENGIQRRVSLSSNKVVAERKLKDLAEKAEQVRAGQRSPVELEMEKSIFRHLAEYELHYQAGHKTEQYDYEIVNKVRRCVEALLFLSNKCLVLATLKMLQNDTFCKTMHFLRMKNIPINPQMTRFRPK